VYLWIAVVGAIKPQPPKVKRHRAPTRPASARAFLFAVAAKFPLPVRAAQRLADHLHASTLFANDVDTLRNLVTDYIASPPSVKVRIGDAVGSPV